MPVTILTSWNNLLLMTQLGSLSDLRTFLARISKVILSLPKNFCNIFSALMFNGSCFLLFCCSCNHAQPSAWKRWGKYQRAAFPLLTHWKVINVVGNCCKYTLILIHSHGVHIVLEERKLELVRRRYSRPPFMSHSLLSLFDDRAVDRRYWRTLTWVVLVAKNCIMFFANDIKVWFRENPGKIVFFASILK